MHLHLSYYSQEIERALERKIERERALDWAQRDIYRLDDAVVQCCCRLERYVCMRRAVFIHRLSNAAVRNYVPIIIIGCWCCCCCCLEYEATSAFNEYILYRLWSSHSPDITTSSRRKILRLRDALRSATFFLPLEAVSEKWANGFQVDSENEEEQTDPYLVSWGRENVA